MNSRDNRTSTVIDTTLFTTAAVCAIALSVSVYFIQGLPVWGRLVLGTAALGATLAITVRHLSRRRR